MKERQMPRTRIMSMATAAARALRAIPSERRSEQSRINGRRSAEPGKKGGRPKKPKLGN